MKLPLFLYLSFVKGFYLIRGSSWWFAVQQNGIAARMNGRPVCPYSRICDLPFQSCRRTVRFPVYNGWQTRVGVTLQGAVRGRCSRRERVLAPRTFELAPYPHTGIFPERRQWRDEGSVTARRQETVNLLVRVDVGVVVQIPNLVRVPIEVVWPGRRAVRPAVDVVQYSSCRNHLEERLTVPSVSTKISK